MERIKTRTIYEIDKMEHRSINSIIVPHGVNIHINGFIISENTISEIRVFKYQDNSKEKGSIFVELYMGNIELGVSIYYQDVVIEIEKDKNDYMKYIYVREAREYDK